MKWRGRTGLEGTNGDSQETELDIMTPRRQILRVLPVARVVPGLLACLTRPLTLELGRVGTSLAFGARAGGAKRAVDSAGWRAGGDFLEEPPFFFLPPPFDFFLGLLVWFGAAAASAVPGGRSRPLPTWFFVANNEPPSARFKGGYVS